MNELHLSCEAGSGGNVVMQGCLTLGTAPFDTLNGIYQTLEFYFVRNCEGIYIHILTCIILKSCLPFAVSIVTTHFPFLVNALSLSSSSVVRVLL